ncbi:phage minor head protein [Muricomes intestini]|uniref:phage head morphogenesis protein n=1 Tax=Muricomes intestini TaxID=1796634 RepID=UPI002FE1A71F
MNKRQKEVQQTHLDAEKKIINQLKRVYGQARKDCEERIAELGMRTDLENIQSIVYQTQYQEAMKQQLDGIIDTLNINQFDKITDYLSASYENGFFGTLYDLQGQGIPLVFPIDQRQVIKALQTDSKISKPLYKRLGEDTNYLKKSIRAELSRGIANGSSWNEMAGHIANGMNNPFKRSINNAIRIARTEGHRIQNEATMDCQQKAKDKGADVVKQWDSTMDGRTRPWHVKADGQIRELDEPFEVGGEKMGAPGVGGSAMNVCNCRCALLQRARWALSKADYTKMNGNTNELVTLKEKNYESFKKKAEEHIEKAKEYSTIKLDSDSFSDAFKTSREKKITQKLIDYVNSLEGADPNALRLYNSIGKIEKLKSQGVTFKISHTRDHAVHYTYNGRTGNLIEVTLKIPKLTGDNISGQVNTTLHEEMHFLDLLLRKDAKDPSTWASMGSKTLAKVLDSSRKGISDDMEKLFKQYKDEYNSIHKRIGDKYKKKIDDLDKEYFPDGDPWSNPKKYKEYKKMANKLWKEKSELMDYECRNALGGGIGNSENRTVLYGHGTAYYRNMSKQLEETIANYGSLSVTRPDLIAMLRRDKPELCGELDKLISQMLERVGEWHE